jgi:hypothetical protein
MNPNISFNDFLLFERQVFGDDFPIAKYDPALSIALAVEAFFSALNVQSVTGDQELSDLCY